MELQKLKELMVFKSKDKTGDFANQLMFVGKPISEPFGPFRKTDGSICYVIFTDGGSDWFSLKELNIDPKSIRKYNPDTDPDFYDAHG